MSAKRFFAEKIEGDIATVGGEEYTHARTVLRVGVGTEIVLLDGAGREFDGVVVRTDKSGMQVHILSAREGEKEPKAQITLLAGYLKNADRNEFIVQKAVELGVSRIAFFSSEYSSAYMNENKLERLKKVAKEATKQCLRSRVPEVSYFSDFREALVFGAQAKTRLFACEFEKKSEVDLKALSSPCTLVVGSEGGFSEREYEEAKSLGYRGVSLGKRILRAETAAIALLSVAAFSLGEWE